MSGTKLKLFVWEEFSPDYRDGLAVAVAENIEQAKKLVIEHLDYSPFDWGPVQEFPLIEARAFAVSGGG